MQHLIRLNVVVNTVAVLISLWGWLYSHDGCAVESQQTTRSDPTSNTELVADSTLRATGLNWENEREEQRQKDAAYFREMGYFSVAKGDLDQAIADFSEAVRLDPQMTNAFYMRGLCRNRKGDFDGAIADFSEAIRLNPKAYGAYYSRGNAWFRKGDLDQAIADYGEVIRLNPSHADAYINRGVAWNEKEEYDKAIADYGEAIRLDPQSVDSFWLLGLSWHLKRSYANARDNYSEAIRLDPECTPALTRLAWLLATCPDDSVRDGEEAVELASRAFRILRDAEAINVLAAALAEAGQYAEAAAWQELLLRDADFMARYGDATRVRLELYRNGKPYRH